MRSGDVMKADSILQILDRCCDDFTFPMLDNGYVYLAGTRLSLFRSHADWAIVIEVFGFSPRAGLPDTAIQTFSSRLHNRNAPEKYVNRQAYENYLARNAHNEYRSIYPIGEGDWQDADTGELVSEAGGEIAVREKRLRLPSRSDYERHGITIKSPRIHTFELCRYLAATVRDDVLATPSERWVSIRPEMDQLLQLEEWNHPNVVDKPQRPSGSQTFQQLAKVLETGDARHYAPTMAPNTHWRNWPEGGSL
jgi:hypothetical protein